MDSYHNHSESNQHYQTSMNNYGFSYNNYDSAYYPGYNSVNSISTSSSNTSPSSIASSPASSTNLNYPLNNFNHLTSPQPYYNQSYSQSIDPSQYTFDQVTLRSSFRKFLADDTIQRLTEISEIKIDWSYKWEEKFADLIVQFKENRHKRIDTYTVL